MNKFTSKFLLSVMIVFLSTLSVPLEGQGNESRLSAAATRTTAEEAVIVENSQQLYGKSISEIHVTDKKSTYDVAAEEINLKLECADSASDKKAWFLEYKSLLKEYENIIDSPETIYDWFTDEELELLFRVVQAEIGDEYSFEQKTHVASVIFNRFRHDMFPDTLPEILVASQFSVISNGRYRNVEVSEDTVLACEYAFSVKDTANGCLFFDSNSKLKYKFVFEDGAHNFYTLEDQKE